MAKSSNRRPGGGKSSRGHKGGSRGRKRDPRAGLGKGGGKGRGGNDRKGKGWRSRVKGPARGSRLRPETPGATDRVMYYTMHVMVFVLPMLFAQISYDQFDIIKVVSLRAVTLFLAALWGWKALFSRRLTVRRSPMDYLILVFLGWVLLSTVFSVHVPTALFGKYRRYEGFISLANYGVLFFLTTQVLTNIKQVRSLIRTALVAAGIISIYGVFQALGADFLTWGTLPFDVNRAFSTFGNPDLLAGYVSLMLPIALVSFVAQDSSVSDEVLAIGLSAIIGASAALAFLALHLSWSSTLLQLFRIVFGLVTGLGLILPWVLRLFDPEAREGHYVTLYAVSALAIGLAALSAFARSAWVAGAATVVLIPVLFARHGLLKSRKVLTLALVIMVAVGSLALATRGAKSDVIDLVARVRSIFQFNEGSAKSRFSIWRSAWAGTVARPLFGYGPDSFRLIFPKHKEVAYTQQVGRLSVADNAHNYPLQLSSTLGIPGMVLFYAVMFGGIYFGFKAAWGKGPRSPDRAMMGGLVIALVAYQVHLFFGISITGSTFLFWMVMAMAVLPLSKTQTFEWQDASLTVRTAAFGVSAVGLAVLFVLNLVYFRADQYYLRSYQFTGYDIDQAIAAARRATALNPYNDMYRGQIGLLLSQKARMTGSKADAQASIDAVLDSIRFNPHEYDNYIFLANAYSILAEDEPRYWDKVIEAADDALEVEPVAPAARFYKGLAFMNTGRLERAVREFKIAEYQDPNYGEVHFYLGQAYQRLGEKKKAREQYELAKTTLPDPKQAESAIQALASTSTT